MAGGATLWPYFMDHLLLIILLLVTLKTSFVPFRFQEMTCLGGMGIMALDAFPSLQSRMHIRFIHPYLILTMAGIADFIPFFFQDKLAD